jgi:hypothetical protein
MGCGSSQNLNSVAEQQSKTKPKKQTDVAEAADEEDDDDSDDDIVDQTPTTRQRTYATPLMDRFWRIKAQFFDTPDDVRGDSVPMDVFMQKAGLEVRDMYKALDVFVKISDSGGKLNIDALAHRLGWTRPKNCILIRQIFYSVYLPFASIIKLSFLIWPARCLPHQLLN